jgi:hypothetical protein
MRRTLLPPDDHELRVGALSAMSRLSLSEQVTPDFVRAGSAGQQQHTGAEVIYLPAAAYCYAIVQYDPTSIRVIRRVVGLFGDVGEAEGYAKDNRSYPYDVVPATAVIPQLP